MTVAVQHKVYVSGAFPHLGGQLANALKLEACREEAERDLVIGVFAMDDTGHVDAQKSAFARGADFVRVLIDIDTVLIGPLAIKGQMGCASCADLWMADRWSASTKGRRPSADPQKLFWPSMAYDVLGDQFAAWLLQARRAAAASEQSVLRLDCAKLHCTIHVLHHHPNCRVCEAIVPDRREDARVHLTPRPKPDPRVTRGVSADIHFETLQRRLCDARSGFVKWSLESRDSHIMPFFSSAFSLDEDASRFQFGVGRTGQAGSSRSVAVLEALERFSGLHPRGRRAVINAGYETVRSQAVDPQDFVLHEAAQYDEPGCDLVPYSDSLPVNWVWAHSFATEGPLLTPEQMAYYGLKEGGSPTLNRFVSEISNGCALGSSWEEAVLHGLYEVIERDAFLTRWYGSLTPDELDITGVEDLVIRSLLARAEANGMEIRVFDIDVGFGVPAIQAVVIDHEGVAPLKTLSAAGANLDPVSALRGALVEVMTSVLSNAAGHRKAVEHAAAFLEDPWKVVTSTDHIITYGAVEALPRLEYILKTRPKIPFHDRYKGWFEGCPRQDLTDDLMAVVGEVRKVASDVLVVDQGSRFLTSLGLSCVKVLAPGLHTVTFGHVNRRISLDRVNKAADATGWRTRLEAQDLNPHPHNFP